MINDTKPVETGTRQSRKAYWSHHLETWQKSGLTQVEYCLQNRLNKHTFTYWKSKLAKQPSFPPLLPVSVQPNSTRKSPFLHSGIVLSIGGQIRIQLENGFNDDTLSRLIDLLERRSCFTTA